MISTRFKGIIVYLYVQMEKFWRWKGFMTFYHKKYVNFQICV